MSAPYRPLPVEVTGGTGGIHANRASMEHLARQFDTAASALGFHVMMLGVRRRELDAPVGPAALDPGGLAYALGLLDAARAELDAAVTALTALARNLGNAVRGYPWGADVLDVALIPTIGDVVDALRSLPGGGLLPGRTLRGHGSWVGESDGRVLGVPPQLVDLAAGLVDPPGLATLFSPHEDDRGGVPVVIGSARVPPPRSLADVITGLGDVDRVGTPGGIDVRVLDGPSGRRVVVDITGTRTWLNGGRNVADLGTNQRALTGRTTAYESGVLAALRAAGVRRDEPVMLVGHSQGGLVAVNAARTAARSGEFRVTHVVTAGAPVGITAPRLPASVQLLALENTGDLVPRLDDRKNPDRRSIVTVRSARGDGSVGGNHAIDEVYVPLARDAQAVDNRSVRDFLTGADDFLTAERAVAHTYRVERR